MPPYKRQKLSPPEKFSSENELSNVLSTEGSSMDEEEEGMPETQDSELNEDAEIENLKPQKSHQTSKRKIRATGSSKFGATLEHLLSTDAPSSLPLSLKPSIARKRNDEKLELRAKKVLQMEKKEKEDKARIKDVIGGWGGESERALRKVAQRGGVAPYFSPLCRLLSHLLQVVRLFNVIQQSQNSAAAAAESAKANRGSGKPTLPAPAVGSKGKYKGKKKDNIIGRGKESKPYIDPFFGPPTDH